MTIKPGWNHLDRQRKLIPRAYCVDPHSFGQRTGTLFHVPTAGDQICAAIAQVQHDLVLRWRAAGLDGSGSRLARQFGFSSSTWSRSLLGERWMGETVMAAALQALRDHGRLGWATGSHGGMAVAGVEPGAEARWSG